LVAILFWVGSTFKRSDWDALVEADKHWSLLGLAFVIVLAGHIVSFARWYVFVRALCGPSAFGFWEAIRLGFLGNLFNFVSLGAVGGDLFKAVAASRQTPGKRTEVAASVLVDRAIGLLGLLIVAALGLQLHFSALSPNLRYILYGAWLFSCVGVISLAVITVLGDRLLPAWVVRLPVVGKTIHRSSTAGLLFYKKPVLVVTLVFMSCIVHTLLTLGMYCVSRSLYFESSPNLGQHFMVVPPAFAAAALPLTPGGIGVQEVAVARLFEELSGEYSPFSGLLVATLYRVLLILIAAIGGLVYAGFGDGRLVDGGQPKKPDAT
jgi:glycosyltransferase 2 family protein